MLIKMISTPLVVLLLSLAARRWGNIIGGIACGLPLTSAPISLYLALEQGASFAGHAATSAQSGIGAALFSYASYVIVSKYCNTLLASTGAVCIYALSSVILLWIARSDISIMVCGVTIYAVMRVTTATGEEATKVCPSRFDLPARLIASTALVLVVTVFADKLGYKISGILSPVPVVAWPLIVFAHIQSGRAEAVATIRGATAGSVGLIAFYLIISECIEINMMVLVYLAAIAASAICSLAFGFVVGVYRLRSAG